MDSDLRRALLDREAAVVDLTDDGDHVAGRDRRRAPGRDTRHSRKRGKALEHRAAKHGRLGAIAVQHAARIETHREDALGPESRVVAGEARETARQKPRADEQHEGEGDLQRNEDPAQGQPPPAGAGDRSRAAFLQRGAQIRPSGMERGRHPEDETREERDGEREDEHAGVELDGGEAKQERRVPDAREALDPREGLDAPEGQQDARDAARDGEDDAFRQHLADDAPAAGADREADRHLPTARRGAREEQCRDVRAGDEENEGDGAEEHEDRAPQGRVDPAVVQGRRGGSPDGAANFHRVLVRDLPSHDPHLRVGRSGGDAGLQASDDFVPVVAVLRQDVRVDECAGHRHGNPDLGLAPEAREAFGQNADDRQRPAVDRDRAADNRRRPAEAALPETVGDQGDRVRARGSVFVGRERAAERPRKHRAPESTPRRQSRRSAARARRPPSGSGRRSKTRRPLRTTAHGGEGSRTWGRTRRTARPACCLPGA